MVFPIWPVYTSEDEWWAVPQQYNWCSPSHVFCASSSILAFYSLSSFVHSKYNFSGIAYLNIEYSTPLIKESKRLKAQLRFIFNKVFAVIKLSGSCHYKRFTDDCTINNIFVLHPESSWTGIYNVKLKGTYIIIRYSILLNYFCSIIMYTFIEQMNRTQKLKHYSYLITAVSVTYYQLLSTWKHNNLTKCKEGFWCYATYDCI